MKLSLVTSLLALALGFSVQSFTSAQSADDLSKQRSEWEQMSAEEKQRCLKVFRQIQNMDPAVRKRLIRQVKSLPAEQKKRLGEIVKSYVKENPEMRQLAKRAFRQRELWLKTQSPEDLQKFKTENPEVRKKHYAEKLNRSRVMLLKKIPDNMLDVEAKKRLLKAPPAQFRQELSRLIRNEIQTVVSDQVYNLVNDFEELSPQQTGSFIRKGEFPTDREDLRLRYEALDESQQRQFKGVIMKINHVQRMSRKHRPPHGKGLPRPPMKGKGELDPKAKSGDRSKANPGDGPRRRKPGASPRDRGPKSRPQLEGTSLEIRDQQA